MMSERFSMRAAARAAGPWLIATLLLAAPATVAAAGDGTDHECGMAEPCAGMSPLPHSSPSTHARRTARGPESSRAADRKAPRKARAPKKVDPSTSTFVATDASTASRARNK